MDKTDHKAIFCDFKVGNKCEQWNNKNVQTNANFSTEN